MWEGLADIAAAGEVALLGGHSLRDSMVAILLPIPAESVHDRFAAGEAALPYWVAGESDAAVACPLVAEPGQWHRWNEYFGRL